MKKMWKSVRYYSVKNAFKNYRNNAGVYHLQENLSLRVFGSQNPSMHDVGTQLAAELEKVSLEHLKRSDLLGKETAVPKAVDLEVPPLLGEDLDSHFQKIGLHMQRPYIEMFDRFVNAVNNQRKSSGSKSRISGYHLLPNFDEWETQSGWTRYGQGKPTKVDYPTDDVIVFDTEVLYKLNDYAVMATAVSEQYLYVWLSPWLLGESCDSRHFVPLGPHKQVVIGHNVGFDRKRVKEEYRLADSPKWFMDTMSLHIAVSGMCNQQRATFSRYQSLLKQTNELKASGEGHTLHATRVLNAMRKNDPWLEHTCANGLDDTVEFYLGTKIDKSTRDYFGELSREECTEKKTLANLVKYCALDSIYTRDLFAVLFPKFLSLNPHSVSLAALKEISSVFLPIKPTWNDYVSRCEQQYTAIKQKIYSKLCQLAEEAVLMADDPEKLEYARTRDPWLRQLDWTIKPPRYTKARADRPPRLMKNQKFPGKPNWYRDLFASKDSEMNITVRSRVTTILLRLKWDEYPLIWYNNFGWSFWVPIKLKSHYISLSFNHIKDLDDQCLFRLPHSDGEKGRCIDPLGKFYLPFFDSGVLNSQNSLANEAIKSNLVSSYWVSCRKRVMSQMPVFPCEAADGDTISNSILTTKDTDLPKNWGMILPRIVPMGAVTRRAVEDTWLTASNAKSNRLGSELKCNVTAPPGYKIIGADVDSEELWIASLIGDSVLKMHGGTAFGWMTLEGAKKNGTDLHSKSASILGISRGEAKVFNYGRIYGAGEKSAVRNLRQFNPSLTVREAEQKAAELYKSTKGSRTKSTVFPLKVYWRGGTESLMYNQLEMLADSPRQKTPILGSGISNALVSRNLKSGAFMTTRVNWSIQSSGVDYLHLIIVGMRYLCDVYKIEARLMLTVHDELRYIATEKDALRVGLALQIANLWTRAMFCQQVGLNSVPQSVAFFSAVDFDTVLRKEVDDPCITPTQVDALPLGEALDINSIVDKCNSLGHADKKKQNEYMSEISIKREPVMSKLNDTPHLTEYVRAQVGTAKEARQIESLLVKLVQKSRIPPRESSESADDKLSIMTNDRHCVMKDSARSNFMNLRARSKVPRVF